MTSHSGVRPQWEADTPPTDMVAPALGHWWTRLDRRSSVFLVITEVAVILVVWQLAIGEFELVNRIFLPPPASVAEGLWNLLSSGEIWPHLSQSLVAWISGYGLAAVSGVAIGIIVGVSVPIYRLLGPVLWSFYAIPWLAYRPLTVAWFGFGLPPIIFLVFIASLFPILLNTAAGVGTTETSLLNTGRIFGSSRLAIYRKIVLPSSLPFVVAGMRQSVVMATLSLLVGEMLGSGIGIGALITIKTNTFRTEQSFALILLAVLWTVSMSQIVKMIAKRATPWQADVRRQ